jgi:hypothetical protein
MGLQQNVRHVTKSGKRTMKLDGKKRISFVLTVDGETKIEE